MTPRTPNLKLSLWRLGCSPYYKPRIPKRPLLRAKMSVEQAREENAYAVGLQAYLWGYPPCFGREVRSGDCVGF